MSQPCFFSLSLRVVTTVTPCYISGTFMQRRGAAAPRQTGCVKGASVTACKGGKSLSEIRNMWSLVSSDTTYTWFLWKWFMQHHNTYRMRRAASLEWLWLMSWWVLHGEATCSRMVGGVPWMHQHFNVDSEMILWFVILLKERLMNEAKAPSLMADKVVIELPCQLWKMF